MTMWIILGSLIFVVLCFLGFTSFRDSKKRKVEKAREEKLIADSMASRSVVATWMVSLIELNSKMIDGFVPSIGNYKMGDIKKNAKEGIKILKDSIPYNLASSNSDNEDIIEMVKHFENTSSSVWNKMLGNDITKMKEIFEKEEAIKTTEYRKEALEKLFVIYKKDVK